MSAKLSNTEEIKRLLESLEDEDCSKDFVEDVQESLQEYTNSIFDMEN